MPTNTYVALDKVTVGTATSTVNFTSIPSGYTDLVLVASGTVNASSYFTFRFNSDTGSNYSETSMYGDGSSAGSTRNSNQTYMLIGGIRTTQTTIITHIMNYSNSTTNKTAISRSNNAAVESAATVGLWRNTAAITSIQCGTGGANTFQTGSTFSLYGIAAAGVSPAAKATGGTIYADDLYYYHVFGSTGTFTPLSSLTADVLVLAGGGGGSNAGGGGGAGGLAYYASQSLTATGYTCTIGGGGAGSTGGAYATIGVNSSFTGLSAAVGGGPGGRAGTGTNNQTAKTGGSGGGSGGGGVDSASPGLGTTGQGNAGGSGNLAVPPGTSGGGGGAGGAGTSGLGTNNGGAGGVGSSSYTTWLSATGFGASGTIAGGGGGGGGQPGSGNSLGGTATGGGGAGGFGAVGTAQNGTSATVNTGGGGGGGGIGSSVDGNGASGGSGLVIVRYAK